MEKSVYELNGNGWVMLLFVGTQFSYIAFNLKKNYSIDIIDCSCNNNNLYEVYLISNINSKKYWILFETVYNIFRLMCKYF